MISAIADFALMSQEVVTESFTQELLVFVVFIASFHIWRRVNRSGGDWRAKAKNEAKLAAATTSTADVPRKESRRKDVAAPAVEGKKASKATEEHILRLLEQREFTRALNVYRSLENAAVNEAVYSAFLLAAIRMGKMDVVERMFRDMKQRHVLPSLQLWQSCLKMLSSRKHFLAILSVAFVFDSHEVPLDDTIYSCFVNAALEAGVHDCAKRLLKRYGEQDVGTRDNMLFFRTYAAIGDADAAEDAFRRLGEKSSTLMLNLLLITCVNAKDAKRAHGIVVDSHLLEKKASTSIVDVVSYNTVLKGYIQEQQEAAGAALLTCVQEMVAHNVCPDDVTLTTILEAGIGDSDERGKVVALLVEGCKRREPTMNAAFLKGLVRAHQLPRALDLYDEIKGSGALDIAMYSLLIKALVEAHDVNRAMKVFEEMKSAGLTADDMLVTHLLEGCRQRGDVALGQKLFEDLMATGAKPSSFLLVALLKLCGHCGAAEDALRLVSTWEQRTGAKPTVIHYTCVMSGCIRSKKYDEAYAVYELMVEKGVSPDGAVYNTLLPGLVAAQDWGRFLLVAKRLPPAMVVSCQEPLNSALAQLACLPSGGAADEGFRWVQAKQLRQILQEAGVPIATRAARSMP